MKNRQLFKLLLGLTLSLGLTGQVLASSSYGPGVTRKEEPEEVLPVSQLKAAGETDQIVLVVGDGTGSSLVNVTYYSRKDTGQWQEIFRVPGYCGYNGLAADKKEGDRKTPAGDYQFTMAFGIYDNPGSVLNYHRVMANDYWVDDSSSSYYNQLVNTTAVPASWNSAEHLIKIVPQYHYGLVLNYNSDCVPGKGSAIFLHGYHTTKTWTEGCIAIPEERMKELLLKVDENTRIIMVPEEAALKEYHLITE